MRIGFLVLFVASGTISGAAIAQTPAADSAAGSQSGKRRFEPAFFAQYAPLSALDMVARIPGFSISGGDGRRGFGENAGNVLINGDRPSTKSDDIESILSRIPASQVAYIEFSEQAGSSADARGQGQVVNVVRKAVNAVSGRYDLNLEVGEKRGATPFGGVSASIRRGPTTYDLSADYFAQLNHDTAIETIRNGRAVAIGRRVESNRGLYSEASASAAVKTKSGTVTINGNAKTTWRRYKGNRTTQVFGTAALLDATERLDQRSPQSEVATEIGGDVAFPLSKALATKIIFLYRTERSSDTGGIITTRADGRAEQFTTTGSSQPSEAILRIQNNWKRIADHAIQFGGELSFNRRASRFAAANTTNGAVTQFPASNVVINERRFEPFVSDVWTVSPKWTIEAGVIAEASQLTLSGDSSAKRTFVFAKPRLVATWAAGPRTNFEFRVERQVAQLDFGDFATSVDLGAGAQVSAGNVDLVPEKTWTFSAQVKRKFFDRGSIQLTARYVRVSDTQDLIPVIVRDASGAITSRFDGAGNIGNSTRWGGRLEITLPFDWLTKPLGVTGLELAYTGNLDDSRVVDPVTGQFRRRSGDALWSQTFNLRQDLRKAHVSWGVNVSVQSPNIFYYVDQIATFRQGADVLAYIEYNKWSVGTLRFQINNLTDLALVRNRTFYRDTRQTGDIITSFNRNRSRDTRFQISFNGKF